jgi:hypothetical protein
MGVTSIHTLSIHPWYPRRNLSNCDCVSRVWELRFFLRDPPITFSDLHRQFSGSRDLHAASRSRNSTSFHAAPDLPCAASSISGSSPYSTIFLARPDAPGRDLPIYNSSPLLCILVCFARLLFHVADPHAQFLSIWRISAAIPYYLLLGVSRNY